MKFLVILGLFANAALVCNASYQVDVQLKAEVPDAGEVLDSFSAALYSVVQASAAAVQKSKTEIEKGLQATGDAIANAAQDGLTEAEKGLQATGDAIANAAQDGLTEAEMLTSSMLSYLKGEADEALTDFNAVAQQLNALYKKTANYADNATDAALQEILTLWNQVQTDTKKLTRSIQKYKDNVTNKINNLKAKFGEATNEFKEGMQKLYSDAETKMYYAFMKAWSTMKNALVLPLEAYYQIDLPAVYEKWTQFLDQLEDEYSPSEYLNSVRRSFNSFFNAVNVKFFLTLPEINLNVWPYASLVWLDMIKIKDIVADDLNNLETYASHSASNIYQQFGNDAAALQQELETLMWEIRQEEQILNDLTQISFTRVYYFQSNNYVYFDVRARNTDYDNNFEGFLLFLSERGYSVRSYSQNFIPHWIQSQNVQPGQLSRRWVDNVRTVAADALQYDSNVPIIPGRSFLNLTFQQGQNQQSPRTMGSPRGNGGTSTPPESFAATVLRAKLVAELQKINKVVLEDLQRCIPKTDKFGQILLYRLYTATTTFDNNMRYLKSYVLRAELFIKANYSPGSVEYDDALNRLAQDAKYRLDVFATLLHLSYLMSLDYGCGAAADQGYPKAWGNSAANGVRDTASSISDAASGSASQFGQPPPATSKSSPKPTTTSNTAFGPANGDDFPLFSPQQTASPANKNPYSSTSRSPTATAGYPPMVDILKQTPSRTPIQNNVLGTPPPKSTAYPSFAGDAKGNANVGDSTIFPSQQQQQQQGSPANKNQYSSTSSTTTPTAGHPPMVDILKQTPSRTPIRNNVFGTTPKSTGNTRFVGDSNGQTKTSPTGSQKRNGSQDSNALLPNSYDTQNKSKNGKPVTEEDEFTSGGNVGWLGGLSSKYGSAYSAKEQVQTETENSGSAMTTPNAVDDKGYRNPNTSMQNSYYTQNASQTEAQVKHEGRSLPEANANGGWFGGLSLTNPSDDKETFNANAFPVGGQAHNEGDSKTAPKNSGIPKKEFQPATPSYTNTMMEEYPAQQNLSIPPGTKNTVDDSDTSTVGYNASNTQAQSQSSWFGPTSNTKDEQPFADTVPKPNNQSKVKSDVSGDTVKYKASNEQTKSQNSSFGLTSNTDDKRPFPDNVPKPNGQNNNVESDLSGETVTAYNAKHEKKESQTSSSFVGGADGEQPAGQNGYRSTSKTATTQQSSSFLMMAGSAEEPESKEEPKTGGPTGSQNGGQYQNNASASQKLNQQQELKNVAQPEEEGKAASNESTDVEMVAAQSHKKQSHQQSSSSKKLEDVDGDGDLDQVQETVTQKSTVENVSSYFSFSSDDKK